MVKDEFYNLFLFVNADGQITVLKSKIFLAVLLPAPRPLQRHCTIVNFKNTLNSGIGVGGISGHFTSRASLRI